MKHYNNFYELIVDSDNYPKEGMIYKEKSKMGYAQAQYWVLSQKEVEERKPYLMLPKSIENTNAECFFDIDLLKYLINKEMEYNPKLTLEQTDVFLNMVIQYIATDQYN
jgi:hypothetical protein